MAGYINAYRKKYGFNSEIALEEELPSIYDAVKQYGLAIKNHSEKIRRLNKEQKRAFEDDRLSLFEETIDLPTLPSGFTYCLPHYIEYNTKTREYYLIDFQNQIVVDTQKDTTTLKNNHPEKLVIDNGSYSIMPMLYHKEKGLLITRHLHGVRKGKFGFKIGHDTQYEVADHVYIYDHINGKTKSFSQWRGEIRESYFGEITAQSGYYNTRFIEEIYGLANGTLNNRISLDEYFKLLKYTGNTYQAFLQTKQYSDWFLDNVIETMRAGGKPMIEKTIQGWLGLNLPDMKFLLNQPDQNMLIHFLITNKHKETSLTEFLKTENKIIELNQKWLKEFDTRTQNQPHTYVSKSDHIVLTRRNKYIMSTNSLPEFMKFYNEQKIYKDHSLYRYLKYIIDEGKRSFNKETKTYLTLKNIEEYLRDYNRMLKQINPQSKYVMPYNVKKAHDSMTVNHLQIMEERRQLNNGKNNYHLNFQNVYKNEYHKALDHSGYVVLTPTCSYDLHEEGSSLNHCVASYADKVLSGRSLIYFMRRRTDSSRPLITIEIVKNPNYDFYTINQARGRGNRLPNDEEKQFINQWVEKFNTVYKEEKRQKTKEQEVKRIQSKEFSAEFINTLRLYGFSDIVYNDELDKNTNYLGTVKKGLEVIIQKQKNEDIYDNESILNLIESLTKTLKKEKVKMPPLETIITELENQSQLQQER